MEMVTVSRYSTSSLLCMLTLFVCNVVGGDALWVGGRWEDTERDRGWEVSFHPNTHHCSDLTCLSHLSCLLMCTDHSPVIFKNGPEFFYMLWDSDLHQPLLLRWAFQWYPFCRVLKKLKICWFLSETMDYSPVIFVKNGSEFFYMLWGSNLHQPLLLRWAFQWYPFCRVLKKLKICWFLSETMGYSPVIFVKNGSEFFYMLWGSNLHQPLLLRWAFHWHHFRKLSEKFIFWPDFWEKSWTIVQWFLSKNGSACLTWRS